MIIRRLQLLLQVGKTVIIKPAYTVSRKEGAFLFLLVLCHADFHQF